MNLYSFQATYTAVHITRFLLYWQTVFQATYTAVHIKSSDVKSKVNFQATYTAVHNYDLFWWGLEWLPSYLHGSTL